jgi:hypothetical protein
MRNNIIGRRASLKVITIWGRKGSGLIARSFEDDEKDPLVELERDDGSIVTCLLSELTLHRT